MHLQRFLCRGRHNEPTGLSLSDRDRRNRTEAPGFTETLTSLPVPQVPVAAALANSNGGSIHQGSRQSVIVHPGTRSNASAMPLSLDLGDRGERGEASEDSGLIDERPFDRHQRYIANLINEEHQAMLHDGLRKGQNQNFGTSQGNLETFSVEIAVSVRRRWISRQENR